MSINKEAVRFTTMVSVAAATTLVLGSVSSAAAPIRRLAACAPNAIRIPGQTVLKLPGTPVQGSARATSTIERPAWLAEAEASLAGLRRLPDRWGGSEKPSELAIRTAQALVRSMERHGHRVLDAAPIADGGIAVYYAEDARPARFDVYNEGGIVVVTRSGHGASAQYAELPATEAAAALADFLHYDDDATSAG